MISITELEITQVRLGTRRLIKGFGGATLQSRRRFVTDDNLTLEPTDEHPLAHEVTVA